MCVCVCVCVYVCVCVPAGICVCFWMCGFCVMIDDIALELIAPTRFNIIISHTSPSVSFRRAHTANTHSCNLP